MLSCKISQRIYLYILSLYSNLTYLQTVRTTYLYTYLLTLNKRKQSSLNQKFWNVLTFKRTSGRKYICNPRNISSTRGSPNQTIHSTYVISTHHSVYGRLPSSWRLLLLSYYLLRHIITTYFFNSTGDHILVLFLSSGYPDDGDFGTKYRNWEGAPVRRIVIYVVNNGYTIN